MVAARGCATGVEKPFGLVEIALLTGGVIKAHKGHLGDLMAGNEPELPVAVAYVAADAVGKAHGYVEKTAFSGSLPVGYGAFDHVAEIIEFMAEMLNGDPALAAAPFVGVRGILCACGVEIAVGFLCGGNYFDNAVDICLKLFVGIVAESVGRSFDGFVDVGVVERKSIDFIGVAGRGGAVEVDIALVFLAFVECEWDGDVAARFHTRAPERPGNFYRGECNGRYGIARM